ncbi:MAG: cyanophycinase [Tenericutes bacterium HGW-Tenericutes-6]|nr:MAG: cyanophycinase [Tenericutes bacterium HGW-Tenericutes-6]PKP50638.1 MAG: cyanophycinase [Bacteroidetes bacterium HGW-Bacteroidetes-12]
MAKGTLIPIGGNEDKGIEKSENYTLEFIQDGILFHIVKEAGGTNSKIIVIPTASSIQEEVGNNYLRAFNTLGCKNVRVLSINSVEEAESEENIKALEECDAVMFSGGDQSRIVQHIGNTKFHQILINRYENEKFVIAGTSAGAMCMSKEMIAGGNITEAIVRGSTKFKKGMGFIPELIIDTHFIKRGRFGRLAEAVAAFPKLVGLGLAENTGVIIKNDIFTVIGSGMAILFDPSWLTHNYREILEDELPLSVTDLKVHILSFGDKFDLKTRSTKIMTLDEYKEAKGS